MVLDKEGHRISARECYQLLGITASPTAVGLRLSSRDGEVLDVATPHSGARTVSTRMSRIDRLALAGSDAGSWLSERLGRPVQLAHLANVRARDLVVQESGEPWLGRDAALERFRPNIVIDGDQPFSEDGWHRVRAGHVTWRVGETCDRYVLTTINVDAFATEREPIRTLARHRRWDGAT